jgi:hypothetical protein
MEILTIGREKLRLSFERIPLAIKSSKFKIYWICLRKSNQNKRRDVLMEWFIFAVFKVKHITKSNVESIFKIPGFSDFVFHALILRLQSGTGRENYRWSRTNR